MDRLKKKSLKALASDESKYGILLELNNAKDVKHELVSHLVHNVGKDPAFATENDWFFALASLLRGIISERYINTQRLCHTKNPRRIYYLSMEWLLGSSLKKHLLDFDIMDITRKALADLGQDLLPGGAERVLSFLATQIHLMRERASP